MLGPLMPASAGYGPEPGTFPEVDPIGIAPADIIQLIYWPSYLPKPQRFGFSKIWVNWELPGKKIWGCWAGFACPTTPIFPLLSAILGELNLRSIRRCGLGSLYRSLLLRSQDKSWSEEADLSVFYHIDRLI